MKGPRTCTRLCRNASTEKPARFLVFLLKDIGKPSVIPVN